MRAKRKEVELDVIAAALTVGEKFDKWEFADKTGIAIECVNPRLYRACNKGHLIKEKSGKKNLYTMTAKGRLLMIAAAHENKKARGKKKKALGVSVKRFLTDELLAHKEAAERILRECDFV